MKVKNVRFCVGSSCHLNGSLGIMKQLQTHIVAAGRGDTVELDGVFCMGKCNSGVSLTVDGVYHSVRIENVKEFFEKEIMKNYGLS